MMYEFTPPPAKAHGPPALEDKQSAAWGTVTLSLPGDTRMGLPPKHWERRGDRIIATYTSEELTLALALHRVRHGVEIRPERDLVILAVR